MNNKKDVCVEPPSDEGGGFCEAKDGGREQQKGATKATFLSFSFAYAQQLPRQRELRWSISECYDTETTPVL